MVGGAGIPRGGRFDRRVLSRGILVGMIRLSDGNGIGGFCFATEAARLDGRKLFFLGWDVRAARTSSRHHNRKIKVTG
jgi:hypothetical protein